MRHARHPGSVRLSQQHAARSLSSVGDSRSQGSVQQGSCGNRRRRRVDLLDESINARVGSGQRILQGERNRRGIVQAYVHPIDAEVSACILRRRDDATAQVSACRRRRNGGGAGHPLRRREASHEAGAFHALTQTLRRDVRIGQFEAGHSRVAQGSAGARAVGVEQ